MRCPAEGCDQMIGGNAELLNASNRLKLPTYLLAYPIHRPVRMFPAEVPQEVTDQARSVAINCLQFVRFQLKVQRGAGEALWSHPGRRPCCRPPCSPPQRGCSGDISDVLLDFGKLIQAGAEHSAQRATAESSLLLLADLPLPGSFHSS